MKFLCLSVILLLTSTAVGAFDWANGNFDAELSPTQKKAFSSFYEKTPAFVYGRVVSTAPKAASPYTFKVKVIHTFKKSLPFKTLTITTPTRPPPVDENVYWVQPIFDTSSSDITGKVTGFSPKQEAVFYEFQQQAGFSKDLGLDQWLTCSKDDECTFVKTCSCFRTINIVYLTKFLAWKNMTAESVCKECGTEESYLETYRPTCNTLKICDKEKRSP